MRCKLMSRGLVASQAARTIYGRGATRGFMSTRYRCSLTAVVTFAAGLALLSPGCNIPIPGFAGIVSTQQFDQPNFTVQFTLPGINTAAVSNVNWWFRHGPGFTPGGVTITHRYNAGGNYNLTAFVFFSGGGNQTINGTVNVIVPDRATNPNPANGAINVPVNTTLSWFPGKDATQSRVYLATSASAVNAATPGSPEDQGTVSGAAFTPSGLAGGTDYSWRIDSIKANGTTTK